MFSFLTKDKKADTTDPKTILNRELFTAAKQKKTVTKAARESADDQKKLVEQYNYLIGHTKVLQD